VGTLADLTKEKINPPYNDRILFYDPATPRMLRTMMGVMMSACDLRISNLSVTEYASTYVASCANEDLGYFADFVNLGKGNYSGCLGADHPIPHNTTESSYWKCYTSEAIGGSGDDTVAASIDTTSGLFCQCFTAFSDVAFEWTWPVQYMGQVVFALTIVMCILSLYVAYYSGTELVRRAPPPSRPPHTTPDRHTTDRPVSHPSHRPHRSRPSSVTRRRRRRWSTLWRSGRRTTCTRSARCCTASRSSSEPRGACCRG